jgi:peptidoglycan/LPS O-acetylase OafA/YrhL
MPALSRATAPAFRRRTAGPASTDPATAGSATGRSIGRQSFGSRLDPRYNSLNAIRLLLACTVIVSHTWSIGKYGDTPRFGGETPGGLSVFAFFVLSGYLITGSRLNNDLTSYLKRRFLRIYPGFLVCLLATIAVFAPIGYYQQHHSLHGYLTRSTTPLDYLISNLTLKMNVYHVAGTPSGPHAWTGSLWSLYYEFYCYLIVGLLAGWAVFRRKPALAIAVFLLATLARLEPSRVASFTRTADVQQLVQLVPFFMAGSVFYLLRNRIPCNLWLAVASLAVCIVLPQASSQNRFIVLCALPMTYLLLYVGAVVPVPFGRRNDISYGMYMYGYPVEQLLRFLHVSSHTVFTVLAILCTVPVAAASWLLVERPAIRWGQRKTPSADNRAAVAAAPVEPLQPA